MNSKGQKLLITCLKVLLLTHLSFFTREIQGFQLPLQTAGDYKSAAIEKSNAGDLDGAIVDFRRAVDLDPYDPMAYNNLGVALMRHGVDSSNVKELKESAKLFKRSLSLQKNSNTVENLELVRNYIKDFAGERDAHESVNIESEWDDTSSYKSPSRSKNVGSNSQKHGEKKFAKLKKQVDKLCTEDNIRLQVTDKEKEDGILKFKKFNRAVKILKLCGVLVLEKMFSRDLMKRMKRAQAKIVDDYVQAISDDPSHTNTTSSEQRSPGRYELVNPLKSPFSDESFVSNTLFMPIIQNILGTKRLEIDTHSSVTSLAKTPEQHWHRDAGFLFDYESVQKHLPPHGMVIFVPLVKVTEQMGPTEFLTGSHIQCPMSHKEKRHLGNWILDECRHAGRTVTTPASTGSAIIFDLRILHRGTANKSPKRRPMMYLTLFQEWFVDHVNFNDKQTSAFDHIPPNLKKLLGRMDTKEYTLLLENTLERLGVDVDAMQSNYLFRKHSFD